MAKSQTTTPAHQGGLHVLKNTVNGHIHSAPLSLVEAQAALVALKAKHEKEAPGQAFNVEIVEC